MYVSAFASSSITIADSAKVGIAGLTLTAAMAVVAAGFKVLQKRKDSQIRRQALGARGNTRRNATVPVETQMSYISIKSGHVGRISTISLASSVSRKSAVLSRGSTASDGSARHPPVTDNM